MTLQIELPPEVEEALREKAELHQLTLEKYVAGILRRDVERATHTPLAARLKAQAQAQDNNPQ